MIVSLSRIFNLLLLLLFSATAQADWFKDNTSEDTFLPVDEAFQASAWHDEDTLYIGFQNADDYYLYRHRFNVESREEGVDLGETQLPPGQFKTDEFLGDVHVFYDQVILRVPYTGNPDDGLDVSVTFQGCADAGLCYPPEQLFLSAYPGSPPSSFDSTTQETVTSPQALTATQSSPTTVPSTAPSEDTRFSNLLGNTPPATTIAFFFLAGLGLTFTPCVLPMIPILSSIIIGQHAGRGRAFMLSASYVTGMAITYAIVGVLMGLFGAGLSLQARLQSPWVLIPFAVLFALFALAMFGVITPRASPRIANRVDAWQARLQRSGPLGLALAGALSVVVVSPCVSAPLAGALVFISSTGNALLGGWALLALALGMGIPLLLVGTFGTSLLPRSGPWMDGVKGAFGVLLLGIAVWLLERLVPGPVALLLWGALAVGTALALGAMTFNQRQGWPRVRQAAGILLLAWGVALVLGAARGGEDPLRPLAGLGASKPDTQDLAFSRITTLAQLKAELDNAARNDLPAFVDFTAEWCISCKVMEREVFPNPGVVEQLSGFYRIRADVTDNNEASRALLDHFGLFGPPSLLFFTDGEEIRQARIQGEVEAAPFARHLKHLRDQLAPSQQGV